MLINKINNPFAKLFYLAHTLQAQGRINPEEKGYLKGVFLYIYITLILYNISSRPNNQRR